MNAFDFATELENHHARKDDDEIMSLPEFFRQLDRSDRRRMLWQGIAFLALAGNAAQWVLG